MCSIASAFGGPVHLGSWAAYGGPVVLEPTSLDASAFRILVSISNLEASPILVASATSLQPSRQLFRMHSEDSAEL